MAQLVSLYNNFWIRNSFIIGSFILFHPYFQVVLNFVLVTEGRRQAGMLADSGLLQSLEQLAVSPTGQQMCLYGDPAYPLRMHLQGPFRHAVLTPQMQEYNAAMSAVRVSVEWLFGDIINYFKFMDFKKNLKIRLSSVGKMYVVCAILRNALTCLYGNQTSAFFHLDPPTLQEYFAWNCLFMSFYAHLRLLHLAHILHSPFHFNIWLAWSCRLLS